MSEIYYRFVPEQIFRILGKDNLAEVNLGSNIKGPNCILGVNIYLWQTDFETINELINNFFGEVYKVCKTYGAMVLADKSDLSSLRILCGNSETAISAAMGVIASIDSFNAKNDVSKQMNVSFFLHKADINFGISGNEERYIPSLISQEFYSAIVACDEFRKLSSRLIVTREAYDTIEKDKYPNRFIGKTENAGIRYELFDFYGSSSPMVIRALDDTKDTFEKALDLYNEGRYYNAKNLFAMVLRDNKFDNVARHYLFKCEKEL
jgi:hypothetical protein